MLGGGPAFSGVYETARGVEGAAAEVEAIIAAGKPLRLGTDTTAADEPRTWTIVVPGPGLRVTVMGRQTLDRIRDEMAAKADTGPRRIVTPTLVGR
jgi:hypothetical protein